MFEGTVDDYELLFKDKQTISVTIKNAYVEGLAAIPYTDCEVYTPLGYHTEVGLLCFRLGMLYLLSSSIASSKAMRRM